MKRLPKKIPASFLRQMDPELALKLETSKITFEADILEIQYRVKRARKSVTIEITMTEKYIMRITPIRRGPGGFAEWGIYHSNRSQSEEIHFLYQAHIEIVRKQPDTDNLTASFTSQGSSLKDLIQKSLRTQLEITSKKIVPLRKGMPAGHVPNEYHKIIDVNAKIAQHQVTSHSESMDSCLTIATIT